MLNSIDLLPTYLQKQPIFKDLCFFIDYLNVDIEGVYNDLRYKYIAWDTITEEAIVQMFQGMGMDYIVNLMNVVTPTQATQLLGLVSLIWLLKGDLVGIDIISDIYGFNYEYTVWHETTPLGTPNTATFDITFYKDVELSEDFQYNFVEFLRKYLYPIVSVNVSQRNCEGVLYSYGYMICQENYKFEEVTV